MWRSSVIVARKASVSRHSAATASKLRSSLQNPPILDVPEHSRTLTCGQHAPLYSHCSTRVTPKSCFSQNTRVFYHDSSSPSHDCVGESASVVSDDALNVFEENPGSISLEFEEGSVSHPPSSSSSSVFDKNGDSLTIVHFASVTDNDESLTAEDETIQEECIEVDLEKLQSVLSLLQSSNTAEGSLESSLQEMGLSLNEVFVIRVLETPLVLGENLLGFFKWVMKKPEFSMTAKAVDALVRAICTDLRKKDAYALWDLVKEVGEKENGLLSTEILNEVIALFSRLGKGKAGLEVFNKFVEFGCIPNADTYYFTIEALCRRSFFDWACSVCEKMLDVEKLPDSNKLGKIISYLCKGSKAKTAHLVYLSAKGKQRYPPRSSVNFLISSLCREDAAVSLALEMLEDYLEKEGKHAIKPISCVIHGLCRIKDVDGAKKLLFGMIDVGPPPGNAVFNMIINALSKAGAMEDSLKLLEVMESRGLKPDVYTYSVIVSGYVKEGEMEKACKFLAEAKKKHKKLNPVIYHSLIRGYCKLGQFDEALKLFGEMKQYGVQPTADEYNKLIQSLCLNAVDWETAEKLLEEMKESGLHLNGITKGLIRAVKELEDEGIGSEALAEA